MLFVLPLEESVQIKVCQSSPKQTISRNFKSMLNVIVSGRVIRKLNITTLETLYKCVFLLGIRKYLLSICLSSEDEMYLFVCLYILP